MKELFNKWGLNGKKQLKIENEGLRKENKHLLNANKALSEEIKIMQTMIELQDKDKSELKAKVHKEQGAKGGLVREINKLKKENELLKQQIEDFKNNHWLVKDVKPGRKPKGQAIRSNAKGINNQVRKIQEEISECREK